MRVKHSLLKTAVRKHGGFFLTCYDKIVYFRKEDMDAQGIINTSNHL